MAKKLREAEGGSVLRRSGLFFNAPGLASARQLYGLLARHVLDVEAEHEHAGKPFRKLPPQRFLAAGIVALAEQAGCGQPFGLVLDNADAPEGNDAAKERRVGFAVDLVLIDDAEGSAVMPADGIDLVAVRGAVEIDPALGIGKAERYGIGIATVAKQGEHARGGLGEHAQAVVAGKLLPLAAH